MTDFGMARNVQQDDIYNKQSRVRISKELQLSRATEYASPFCLSFLFNFDYFFPKRVAFLLSGLLMKPCYLEHTQHKVTCKYITTFNITFSKIIVPINPGGGGRRYSTKFNTGRFRPDFQLLTLISTILPEKVPLLHTFY